MGPNIRLQWRYTPPEDPIAIAVRRVLLWYTQSVEAAAVNEDTTFYAKTFTKCLEWPKTNRYYEETML